MSDFSQTFLFEVSYEVAHFVGGIHTVLSTKAREMQRHISNYILIGPYKQQSADKEFHQTKMPAWIQKQVPSLTNQGIIIHYGEWKVSGRPKVILIEFQSQYQYLNETKKKLYDNFKIESHDCGTDVDEPMALSLAAAKVIKALSQEIKEKKIIVHSHEWMCGYTNLFLKDESHIHTVFTTHATMLGRTLASTEEYLIYGEQDIDGHQKAKEHSILAKHTAEKACAQYSDAFTTVSDVTAVEATRLLTITPDSITYNGINTNELYPIETLFSLRKKARNKLERVAKYALADSFDNSTQTQYWVISGRHEPHNKGYDLAIDSLAELKHTLEQQIIVFILVPHAQFGVNTQLKKRIANEDKTRHQLRDLLYHQQNEIPKLLDENEFFNNKDDMIKILYVPEYLFTQNELFDLSYSQLLTGFDLGIFPSFYEPWGYTPHECAAAGVGVITSNTAGFGQFIQKKSSDAGITLINREHANYDASCDQLTNILAKKAGRTQIEIIEESLKARVASRHCKWKHFVQNYLHTYEKILTKKTLSTKNKDI